MKSKLIVLSLAFVLFLLWGHEAVYAQEPITNLDTGEHFWTIQEAIDDADTLSGHTISVTAGIYNENVLLEKGLTLRGAGSEHTVVKAVTATQEVLLVQGTEDELLSDVTIEGFTFSGGHLSQPSGIYYVAGMRVVDAVDGHFRDIVIKDVGNLERGNYYGARVNNGGGHTFEDLTVEGLHGQFTWALQLSATEDNTFTRTTITNTVAELNGFGLYLTDDTQRNVFTDTMIANIVSTDWVAMGFQLRRSFDNRFTRSTVQNVHGTVQAAGILTIIGSARNTFTETVIENITSAGDWGGLSVLGIHISGAGVDDNAFYQQFQL